VFSNLDGVLMTQTPTLTQVQIIQSLAEALSWMEKELSWGVALGELNHLSGRIGELYAAMITRGQMALATNQQGYDVVSAANERISVKCVTSSAQVSFNQNTFHLVDRIIVLRIVNDPDTGLAVEELLDCPAAEAEGRMRTSGSKIVFSTSASTRSEKPLDHLAVTARAVFRNWELRKYENGAIRIFVDGVLQNVVVKDVLRVIAPELGVAITNAAGEVKTTHQLGSEIIRGIEAASSST
jgi:hypothetical protein